jgi:hypothetical protein
MHRDRDDRYGVRVQFFAPRLAVSRDVWAIILAVVFIGLGLFVLEMSKTMLGTAGDAVYITLLLSPILIYSIATGRVKEFRGPGGTALTFVEAQSAVAEATRSPNETMGRAILEPNGYMQPMVTGGSDLAIRDFSSSENENIVQAIKDAVTSHSADPVAVNLHRGKAWLATRLYLLAVLLADYTLVQYLVFFADADGTERVFVGIATPRAVREAMARLLPKLEYEYRTARATVVAPNQLGSRRWQRWSNHDYRQPADPIAEVSSLITQLVSPPTSTLNPPQEVQAMYWIDRQSLEQLLWPNLDTDAMRLDGSTMTQSQIARRILGGASVLVPIVRHGRLERLVDRGRFGTEFALDSLLQPVAAK